jgi:hypothetical protein
MLRIRIWIGSGVSWSVDPDPDVSRQEDPIPPKFKFKNLLVFELDFVCVEQFLNKKCEDYFHNEKCQILVIITGSWSGS